MKKIRTLVLLIGLLTPCLFFGQGETATWYFGNRAGIKFNNDGSVTPLTDGRINTVEGCASISDPFGDLLFYTDGIFVYDRNHNTMENGTGLYGDPSSTQSAIIVPKPEDPNIYYIFTVDTSVAEADADRGLNYSVVDLSMNDGNGAVVEKNINLLTDCSEKVAALLKNCFDESIWVVTLASEDGLSPLFNTYHAFEVSTAGVATNSVKTTFSDLRIEDPRGYIKFSPDGSKMASANMRDGLQLFDFDSDTGIFSNRQDISITDVGQLPYGIEFSAKGQFLYAHTTRFIEQQESFLSLLLQFDIEAIDISASKVELDRRPIFRGALQIGNNGKIYRTLSDDYFTGKPFLSVINNPDSKGVAANYSHRAVTLSGRNSTQGLPPFIQSFFDKTDLLVNENGESTNYLEICEGDPFRLETTEEVDAIYNWSKDGIPFDNPDQFFLNIDSSELIDQGRYQLEILSTDPKKCPILGEAVIRVNPIPTAENLFLKQCDIINPSDGITQINLNQVNENPDETYYYYESQEDLLNDNVIPNIENYTNTTAFLQTLYYKSVNEFNCENYGLLEIEVVPTPPDINSPLYVHECSEKSDGQELRATFDLEKLIVENFSDFETVFYATMEDATLEKNAIIGIYESGTSTIFARQENANQCENIVNVELIVHPSPVITLKETYLICTNNPELSINAPTGYDRYLWTRTVNGMHETISEHEIAAIKETGDYSLTVAYEYPTSTSTFSCEASFDFKVLPSNPAMIRNIKIKDISANNTLEVFVDGDGNYEYSLDGFMYQESNFFEGIAPGFYTMYVRDSNGCGISEQELSVIGYPKFFTPNGDGINDNWQLIGVNDNFQVNSSVSIFDRYGKSLVNLNASTPSWNGTKDSKALPAADYWFKATLEDGREFKGHFSLKK